MNNSRYVLLVFPRVSSNVVLKVLPFGLLSIAASLRHAGFTVEIFDLNVRPERLLLEAVKSGPILYVGFSVFTGPMIQEALALSAKIRHLRSDVPLVWGGPHPTIMPEVTIGHPLVDIICLGEGEGTAVGLAEAIQSGRALDDLPGIMFKEAGRLVKTAPAERIPQNAADRMISFDLGKIDLTDYIFMNQGRRSAIFLTSRGCPYRCRFCWNLMFHGRRYTAWSPDKVLEELKPLMAAGVERVLLYDSFLGSVARVQMIGELFQKSGLEWAIEDGCRVDYHNTDGFFRSLAKTGCRHVAFGAESGSQRMLDLMHKDITVDDLIQSAEIRRPYAIGGRYQWMTGVPGETRDDYMQTFDLIDRISKINSNSAHVIELYLPYPGNELFDQACAMGWTPPQSLSEWGTFRWEGEYPYHAEGTWFYKTVQYSNIFYRQSAIAAISAFTSQVRPVYRLASRLLWPSSMIRWRTRFFSLPMEYWLAERVRKRIERP